MSVTQEAQQTDPRYPVGRFKRPEAISGEDRAAAIAIIAALPERVRAAVEGLGREQLETPYRQGGWTVRQTVHHIADSHINAYVRLRLALTEDWPMIKPYDEKSWANLHDAATAPLAASLDLLTSLHARWAMLLESLTAEQWERGVTHPENGRMSIDLLTQLYAWHSRHHVAHITTLRQQKGW